MFKRSSESGIINAFRRPCLSMRHFPHTVSTFPDFQINAISKPRKP
ncbi:hypothetical protein NEIMUCOT_04287 [Neisseria mucosa ATCC 25996]|uniref:Uncharacterized protein n=1 Tax=Neisseria mucosa (strain ATCC 25996 / DSM 4631 / NCTC 10774 / M26) TaxID=546266 RepID=D2ZUJ9_NEIM2|nr:hypothetical protein NEIMUCOT_04287 [Neisseria mucosa ATCC 25996]